MDFSITQLSPSINQAQLQQSVGVAMLAKTMDVGKKLTENVAQMLDAAALERSVNPSVGSNFDMSV